MSFDRLLPEVLIEQVSFSEQAIQITYFERKDLTEFVTVQHAMLVDVEQVQDEVDEIQDLLREIVDKALVLKRNPPKRLRRPRPVEDDDGELPETGDEGPAVDEEGGV
jgi:hypothetical protein